MSASSKLPSLSTKLDTPNPAVGTLKLGIKSAFGLQSQNKGDAPDPVIIVYAHGDDTKEAIRTPVVEKTCDPEYSLSTTKGEAPIPSGGDGSGYLKVVVINNNNAAAKDGEEVLGGVFVQMSQFLGVKDGYVSCPLATAADWKSNAKKPTPGQGPCYYESFRDCKTTDEGKNSNEAGYVVLRFQYSSKESKQATTIEGGTTEEKSPTKEKKDKTDKKEKKSKSSKDAAGDSLAASKEGGALLVPEDPLAASTMSVASSTGTSAAKAVGGPPVTAITAGTVRIRLVALAGTMMQPGQTISEPIVEVFGPRTEVPKKKSSAPKLYPGAVSASTSMDEKETNKSLGALGLKALTSSPGVAKKSAKPDAESKYLFEPTSPSSHAVFYIDPEAACDSSSIIRFQAFDQVVPKKTSEAFLGEATITLGELLGMTQGSLCKKKLLPRSDETDPQIKDAAVNGASLGTVMFEYCFAPSSVVVPLPTSISTPAEVTFLVVEVLRASELRKADVIGSSDPLLSIAFSAEPKKAIYATPKCINNTLYPLWGGDGRVAVTAAQITDVSNSVAPTFLITIEDKDPVGKDFLGEVEFTPKSYCGSEILTLNEKGGVIAPKESRGSIQVIWTYSSTKYADDAIMIGSPAADRRRTSVTSSVGGSGPPRSTSPNRNKREPSTPSTPMIPKNSPSSHQQQKDTSAASPPKDKPAPVPMQPLEPIPDIAVVAPVPPSPTVTATPTNVEPSNTNRSAPPVQPQQVDTPASRTASTAVVAAPTSPPHAAVVGREPSSTSGASPSSTQRVPSQQQPIVASRTPSHAIVQKTPSAASPQQQQQNPAGLVDDFMARTLDPEGSNNTTNNKDTTISQSDRRTSYTVGPTSNDDNNASSDAAVRALSTQSTASRFMASRGVVEEGALQGLNQNKQPAISPLSPQKRVPVTVPALLKLRGVDMDRLESAPYPNQVRFLQAVLKDIADALMLDPIQLSIVNVGPGLLIDFKLQLTDDQARRNIADAFVQKTLAGMLSLRSANNSFVKDLGGKQPAPIAPPTSAFSGADGSPTSVSRRAPKMAVTAESASVFGEFRVADEDAPRLEIRVVGSPSGSSPSGARNNHNDPAAVNPMPSIRGSPRSLVDRQASTQSALYNEPPTNYQYMGRDGSTPANHPSSSPNHQHQQQRTPVNPTARGITKSGSPPQRDDYDYTARVAPQSQREYPPSLLGQQQQYDSRSPSNTNYNNAAQHGSPSRSVHQQHTRGGGPAYRDEEEYTFSPSGQIRRGPSTDSQNVPSPSAGSGYRGGSERPMNVQHRYDDGRNYNNNSGRGVGEANASGGGLHEYPGSGGQHSASSQRAPIQERFPGPSTSSQQQHHGGDVGAPRMGPSGSSTPSPSSKIHPTYSVAPPHYASFEREAPSTSTHQQQQQPQPRMGGAPHPHQSQPPRGVGGISPGWNEQVMSTPPDAGSRSPSGVAYQGGNSGYSPHPQQYHSTSVPRTGRF